VRKIKLESMDAHSLLLPSVSGSAPSGDSAKKSLGLDKAYCEEIDELGIVFMLVLEFLPQAVF
jgi:hypothetical protein